MTSRLVLTESDYRRFLECSLEGVWAIDRDGRTTYMNRRMREMLGYSEDEVLGRPVSEFVVPEQAEGAVKGTAACLRGLSAQYEVEYLRKDGSRFCALMETCPLYEGGPVPVGALATASDITAHKRGESEQKFHGHVMSALAEGVVLIRAEDGRIVYTNRKLDEMFGYGGGELIGRSVTVLIASTEATPEVVRAITAEIEAKGEWRGEIRNIRKDGQSFWCQAAVSVYRHPEHGEVWVALHSDITVKKQMEEDLRHAQAQLLQSQKLESIGLLAGGIAHDFNNILCSIAGFAELVRERVQDSPDLVRHLDVILSSSQRGAELTKQMLGFARKGPFLRRKLDVSALLDEAKRLLSRSLEKTIVIETAVADGIRGIEGDGTQILQTLLNLGINARDAMPNGGNLTFRAETITLDAPAAAKAGLSSGDYVHVSVSDTGTGIPLQIQDRIFDPFFTTKDVGRGTGLGLAMAYGIMKSHRGAITFDTEIDHGTNFHLYFPALSQTRFESEEAAESVVVREASLSGKSVLIVDDEAFLRELAREVLAPTGAKLLFAENGAEAIEQLKSHAVDAVLLDIGMPRMNGLEVFAELRRLGLSPRVVFATGYSEQEQVAGVLNEKGVDFIAKPYDCRELVRKLAA